METVDRQQALDAALAQIDRAFGKDSERERDYVKVWTDPFTEDLVLDYIRSRVEGYFDDDGAIFHDDFWFDLRQEMARGEHRVISHPKNRRWPPFTPWEDMRLAVRRFLGLFQRA